MKTILISLLLLSSSWAWSAEMSTGQQLQQLRSQWQQVLDGHSSSAMRYEDMQAIAKASWQLAQQHPHNARLRAWSGIALGSLASLKGSRHGAASLAYEAQQQLARAVVMDPEVLDGELYQALSRVLEYNPTALDLAFFYGAFMPGELAMKQQQTGSSKGAS